MQLFVVTNHRTDMNLTTSLVILVIFPFFTQIFTTLPLLIHHTTHCASTAHQILPFLDLSSPSSGIITDQYFCVSSPPGTSTSTAMRTSSTLSILGLSLTSLTIIFLPTKPNSRPSFYTCIFLCSTYFTIVCILIL